MIELSVTEGRARLADAIDQARAEQEPVFLSRRGRRVAAIVDADQWARVVALAEDAADLRAAAEARAEMEQTGEEPVPWDDVKRDLGLS